MSGIIDAIRKRSHHTEQSGPRAVAKAFEDRKILLAAIDRILTLPDNPLFRLALSKGATADDIKGFIHAEIER